ncbi:uncharacterized protein TNCV_3944891 [Trichonephila clavipes]|nr:uncharacterized protein TNCV_3944891 [Trichonephila clavipes]
MSRQAAREAHVKVDASLKNQEIIDVSVSYDGTWQKQGHTSNLGLGIIIDVLSGLVLDFEVLLKYCQNCVVAGRDMGVDSAEFHIWQKGHVDECGKNFDGTSGEMEMHAALIVWRRSISDCQMRFVSMLSDDDSKTFQFLSDYKIYGSDTKIEKEECLNHIAKRLGTSLRNKMKEWKVKPQGHTSMRTYLSPQVGEKIMPVYERLALDTILERCVAGKTQNSNESLHSCIWRKCSKEVFISKRRLEIAVTDVIERQNLGYVKSLEAKRGLMPK